jgi:hypothetical protein
MPHPGSSRFDLTLPERGLPVTNDGIEFWRGPINIHVYFLQTVTTTTRGRIRAHSRAGGSAYQRPTALQAARRLTGAKSLRQPDREWRSLTCRHEFKRTAPRRWPRGAKSPHERGVFRQFGDWFALDCLHHRPRRSNPSPGISAIAIWCSAHLTQTPGAGLYSTTAGLTNCDGLKTAEWPAGGAAKRLTTLRPRARPSGPDSSGDIGRTASAAPDT